MNFIVYSVLHILVSQIFYIISDTLDTSIYFFSHTKSMPFGFQMTNSFHWLLRHTWQTIILYIYSPFFHIYIKYILYNIIRSKNEL